MTTRILSIDIGSINYALGFAEFVPGGLIRILHIELFSPKPSKSTSWGAANDRLTTMLHDRLTQYATPSDKLYTVVEKQITKSRANSHLALMTQSAVRMWSLSHGRQHDTFRYLWAPEKFIDPVPANVKTHLQWKRHGIKTIREFLSEHHPTFEDLHDLIFNQHSDKPDDMCDCLLQMIATHHRLQSLSASASATPSPVVDDDGLVDTESESDDEPEPRKRAPTAAAAPAPASKKAKTKPKPKPKSKARAKVVSAGPIADLDEYA